MKKYIIPIIIVLVVIAIILIQKPFFRTSDTTTVRIGLALALSGDAASWGEQERNGVILAQEELNAKGGIDKNLVEFITEDTKSASVGSTNAVQKLVNFDKVQYIIGPTWFDSYPGAQGVVKNTNVLMITPSASATAIQQPEKISNIFSVWYRTDAITDGLAKFMNTDAKKNIALVFQNDAYYQEVQDFFVTVADKNELNIVSKDLINPGETDFKTLLARMKLKNVDAIFFGMYDESMLIGLLRDHTTIAPNIAIYTNQDARGWINNKDYQPYISNLKFVDNAPMSETFVKKYTERFKTEPTLSASTAYDTLMIIAEAIEKSDNPREYITKHSFSTTTFGVVSFDEWNGIGTKNKQYQMFQVIDGEAVKI